MTVNISTEKVGTRIYVTGNTYAVKDRLKDAGCHWDGDRKQWWIGAAKADKIASIVGGLDGQEVKEDIDRLSVHGKVKYTGQSGKSGTYFVIGRSAKTGVPRLRLTNLMGSIDFWANESACEWVKRYEPREVTTGFGRNRYTETRYQTLGGLRAFMERAKKDPGSVRPSPDHVRCRHCRQWTLEGDDWCMACGQADYE